jgi:hypothetical protein
MGLHISEFGVTMPMIPYWKAVKLSEFLCTAGMLPCQQQGCLDQIWHAGANSLMKSIHGLYTGCSSNMSWRMILYCVSNFVISDIVKQLTGFYTKSSASIWKHASLEYTRCVSISPENSIHPECLIPWIAFLDWGARLPTPTGMNMILS